MNREAQIQNFDPSGVGVKNGHFIGLPFTEETAQMVLLPVPWDVTTSYAAGTAGGPANILAESVQLDLYDQDLPEAWKMGLYMRPVSKDWFMVSRQLRERSGQYIHFVEEGGLVAEDSKMAALLNEINQTSHQLSKWVEQETLRLMDAGKYVGVIGGEHSVPLGFLRALGQRHEAFGVLQIDAHMDLRKAYEGFTQSHASIFYNALQIPQIKKLVQVGIRDCAASEVAFAKSQGERVTVFYDAELKEQQYLGTSFSDLVDRILRQLPQKVYVSFDIDGLEPMYCPHTGTPVMGGLHPHQTRYLIKRLVESGRQIIGFDLCEVAGSPHVYDGNVGARITYLLCNWMGRSQKLL